MSETLNIITGGRKIKFTLDLPSPFFQRNWYGKKVVNTSTFDFTALIVRVQLDVVKAMLELPKVVSQDKSPLEIATILLENSDKVVYIIAKAYENTPHKEPDKGLIDYIKTNFEGEKLMEAFFMAYHSIGLDYFVESIKILSPVGDLLRPSGYKVSSNGDLNLGE